MRLITNKLISMGVIGAVALGSLVACNNGSEDNASRQPSTDTGAVNSNVAPPNANNTAATTDSTSKNTSTAITNTATTGKMSAKKRRTTAMIPQNSGSDKMVKDNEGVYNNAQIMPQFPGGQNGLDTYVNDHIDYPQQAIDNNTSGTVRVSFVIDENGNVSKAHLIGGQKLGDGLDEEALKVVNKMPTWKPGKVNGKNVKIRLELPIAFQVEA